MHAQLPIPGVAGVAIVGAMKEELASLRARLREPQVWQDLPPGCTVTAGWLGARPVVVAATGDGAVRARRGIEALLARADVSWVIVVGIAGALCEGLAPGEIVVAERVMDVNGAGLECPGLRHDRVAELLRVRTGVVMSAPAIADTGAQKRALGAIAAAPVALVDLESATYVEAAERAHVPWLVLRAVSDTVDESLPEWLNQARNPDGSVDRGQVVRRLITSPRALPRLWLMRQRMHQCAGALADAVVDVIDRYGDTEWPTAVGRKTRQGAHA